MKKVKQIKANKIIKVIILTILIIILCILMMYKEYKNNSIIDVMSANNWGLSFQKNNECPRIDYKEEELISNEMYYLGDQEKKKIYLTFDAGFENGNTEKILDTLNRNNVKACFFLVGNYLEKEPELVKKIAEEGHIIGNHTYHHRDMQTIVDKEEFMEELKSLEVKYQEITGKGL